MPSATIRLKTRRELLMTGAWGAAAFACLGGTLPARGLPTTSALVETVSGPLEISKLGFTLTHEHIADAPDVLRRWPKSRGGRAGLVARAIATLRSARAAGIDTVVDLTTYDVGRDIRFLQEVSRTSGLTIIAATGQRFFPPKFSQVTMPAVTVDGLADFFTEEIQQGIDGTAIKAGVIKIGIVGKEPTALEEIGLRAAARASKATGVPIRTHTDAHNRAGESHARILEDEGIDPRRVSFDHSDDSGDIDYFLGLVRRGYSLGMDHVHRGLSTAFQPAFETRADRIRQLVAAGFADKIFLSQDCEFGGWLLPSQAREWRETIDPPQGLLFVRDKLIPYLKVIGVSDRDVSMMTRNNPQRFFARKTA